MFNSAALTLSFDRTTLANTSASSDPVTPVIVGSFEHGPRSRSWQSSWYRFLFAAPPLSNVSRIIYSMAREARCRPCSQSRHGRRASARDSIYRTRGWNRSLVRLNDQAVATIIAFGTGGLYAMFTVTTGVGLYTRLTGRWNPALGHLKLGRWGLPINVIAFHWSVFEFINIASGAPPSGVAGRPGGNSGPYRWF